jgi:hypothetical protein
MEEELYHKWKEIFSGRETLKMNLAILAFLMLAGRLTIVKLFQEFGVVESFSFHWKGPESALLGRNGQLRSWLPSPTNATQKLER